MHGSRSRLAAAALVILAVGCSSAGSDGSGRSDGTATTRPSTAGITSSTTGGAAAAPPAAQPSVPSAGCKVDQPQPGRSEQQVTTGTGARTYLRYVPTGIEAGDPRPLILDLTAYSPASMQEAFSGFTTEADDGAVRADEAGIVVITPEPTNGAGSLLTWNYVGTPGWSDDQAFVTDLLDDVEATVCIDTSRVFLTGFAVGGVFGSIVACEQADRFAGLATVAGLYAPEGCAPSKPLPVISFHGTGDRFIPFDGSIGSGPQDLPLSPETIEGLTFMASREGAVASSEAWARHDGCEPEPATSTVADGVVRSTWSGCDGDVSVELYEIDGGEHTWPGSLGMGSYTELLGPVSTQVDATDLILEFFGSSTS